MEEHGGEGRTARSIVLRPRIVVGQGTGEERVRRLVEAAHRQCFIASSLRTEIEIESRIEVHGAAWRPCGRGG